ncbi:MAG TPA: TlyA family RNA methyltransferase [Polyangia bacterium]|nr:TlyA family RNA methyltransferase [Polyangia bacterium]
MAHRVKPRRERADKLLIDQGLAGSRERARALILAGAVLAGDRPLEKPGQLLPADAELRLRSGAAELPFVSRGGLKLAHALAHFDLLAEVRGAVCADIGASTGGFTDCLLQAGAARVYAIDVGYGQLAWKLRSDPRVRVLERQNVRQLAASALGEPVDLAVVDVSFISLLLVLPRVAALLRAGPGRPMVALVKPQFEAGRGAVGKGGVVRDPIQRAAAVEKVAAFARSQGFQVVGQTDSPIEGPAGNREVLMLIRT